MSKEIMAQEPTIASSQSFDKKHTLEFNEKSHRYKLDGKACSGWTTVIKAGYPTSIGLTNWMKTEAMKSIFGALTVPGEDGYYPRQAFWPISQNVYEDLLKTHRDTHEEVAREAADIGTITHGFAELHSLGKEEEAKALLQTVSQADKFPVILLCVEKYLEWDKKNKGKLVLAEALTASPTHLICGKFDRLDLVNGKLRLRDYKTSKSIYPDQFIQLGGYRINIREWLGINVDEFEVLRFGKEDGSFENLLIDDPKELQEFEDQAIECLKTFRFKTKFEKDKRFDWRQK